MLGMAGSSATGPIHTLIPQCTCWGGREKREGDENFLVGLEVKFNLLKIALLLGRRAGFPVSCVM